jgi:pimeloyl-ACP methyl ester carboxylesterase
MTRSTRRGTTTARLATTSATATALVIALVLAGCSDDPSPARSVGPSTKPTSSNESGAAVEWTRCDDRDVDADFSCATLVVPLDYTDPDGRQIDIALTRRPARDDDNRIGSLLINYGGPGAPGVEFLQASYDDLPEPIKDRFDLVSFDPRGVGQSTAIECGDDAAATAAFDGDPDTADELEQALELHAEFVAACERNAGDLLPFLGTNNAARDLDRIREAVGDDALTYLGYSYGTSLGYAYATLFPDRIRALVLDGVVDPQLSPEASVANDAKSFEAATAAFFSACEARRDCPIGPDPQAVMDRVLARLEDGETLPTDGDLLGEDDRILHLGEAQIGILRALYDSELGWQYLELGLEAADQGDGTLLLALSDDFTDYKGDGEYGNLSDANVAINCADEEQRPGYDDAERLADELADEYPIWGRFIGLGLAACTGWPTAVEPIVSDATVAGAPPILLIGTTGDPATPYEGAVALSEQLASGVLLTYEAEGHTAAYQDKSDCVDEIVTAYFVDLETPPSDTLC